MNTPREVYKNTTNSAVSNSSSVGMLGKNSGHGTKLGRRYSSYAFPTPSSYNVNAPPSRGTGIGMTLPSAFQESHLNSTPGLHPYRVEDNVSIGSAARLPMDGRIRPSLRSMGSMRGIGGGARAA